MGILPMSITGILPVSLLLPLLCKNRNEKKKKQQIMSKMAMLEGSLSQQFEQERFQLLRRPAGGEYFCDSRAALRGE